MCTYIIFSIFYILDVLSDKGCNLICTDILKAFDNIIFVQVSPDKLFMILEFVDISFTPEEEYARDAIKIKVQNFKRKP